MNEQIRPPVRERGDLCPGVLRPWPAADGALVRLRLVGGELPPDSLAALMDVARRHGDGNVHLTRRANLQLRALPARESCLASGAVEAIIATGLLPSTTHELVRNIMVSPLSGIVGGRVDLRPLAAELDRRLCADPVYAGLSARFLFVLDDGRGDLAHRSCDLGVVALDEHRVQLRVGSGWGPVVPLAEAAEELLALARDFVTARGAGPEAAWHVNELTTPFGPEVEEPDCRVPAAAAPLAPGPVGGTDGRVEHVVLPAGILTGERAQALLGGSPGRLVVTPWRGVLRVRA